MAFLKKLVLFLLLVTVPAFGSELPVFATPKEGFTALVKACADKDKNAILSLLGESYGDDLFSSDEVDDQATREKFVTLCKQSARVTGDEGNRAVLLAGFERWPFPIPMVKGEKGWTFDTETGIKELLVRRVGRNELNTIEVCKTYVAAQREYASKDRDGDDVLEYAQFLGSTPGAKDGLFWETAEGEEESPLGPFIASARGQGYESKRTGSGESVEPYHGYLFRILYKQGKNAPGGDYDYIIKKNMIVGFALVAYPADYGNSGVMTFIVSHTGKVFQKDLGEKTADKAKGIKKYDPDETWELMSEIED